MTAIVPPEPFATVAALAAGLVLGSFLNVCIHRLPLGESVVRPRSRCPNCRGEIAWYQNVPVVSWIALGARCARCGTAIPWRYPAVELLGGIVTAGAWRAFGPSAAFAIVAGFALSMIVLFFTDLDHQMLPDAVTLPGFVLGIAVAWFNPFLGEPGLGRVWAAIAGAATGAGILWGIGAVYQRVRGVEAMGMGDVKMLAFVGAFAGPRGALFTIFLGSVLGAVVGVLRIPLRGGSLRDTLPFGCFLAPSAIAALLFARRVFAAYFDLVLPPGS